MLLRDSAFKADATWADAVRLATSHRGEDTDGYRAEFGWSSWPPRSIASARSVPSRGAK